MYICFVYLIRSSIGRDLLRPTMISVAKLEKAIHSKFSVHHLEVLDVSDGCGESYSILLVSDVSNPAVLTVI